MAKLQNSTSFVTSNIAKGIVVTCISIVLFSFVAVAQNDSTLKAVKENISKGDKFFKQNNLKQAIYHYSQAATLNPEDAIANLKMGKACLESVFKNNALPYLEKAFLLNPLIDKEIDFLLAKSYQLNARWDEALKEYQKYKESGKGDNTLLDKRIAECKVGKKLSLNLVKVKIRNMGDSINSDFPDYAPVISADESIMMFTSRRPYKAPEARTAVESENIFISNNNNGKWSKAKPLGKPINTYTTNRSIIALSNDAQKMLVYIDINGDGAIYESSLKGDAWTIPVKLPEQINTPYHESSASISFDGKKIYFVSDQDGGVGGRDIYVSTLSAKGKWSKAENLGKTINTAYDEEGVVIHPDGKTIYFSSKGHETSGGYDVFKSTLVNDKWTEPVNVGYPINSPDDDVFFVISASGKHAYYSTVREKGEKLTGMDIYELTFENASVPVIQIKGVVLVGAMQKPTGASIEVKDAETGKQVMVVTSNSSTGEYLLVLPQGKKYNISIAAEGYKPYAKDIYIPDKQSFYQLFQEVTFSPLKAGNKNVGQEVSVQNTFFDINKPLVADSSSANPLVNEPSANDKSDASLVKDKLAVKGMVVGVGALGPVAATIKITDKNTGKVYTTYTSSASKGDYSIVFPPGKNFEVSISAPGYKPHTEDVVIPDEKIPGQLLSDVQLLPDTATAKAYPVIPNVFDVQQVKPSEPSQAKDKLAVKGMVMGVGELGPVAACIKITDKKTGKVYTTYTSSASKGDYALVFPPGKNFEVSITAPGYKPHTEVVVIPDQKELGQLISDIQLLPDTAKEKTNPIVENFFDVQKVQPLELVEDFNTDSLGFKKENQIEYFVSKDSILKMLNLPPNISPDALLSLLKQDAPDSLTTKKINRFEALTHTIQEVKKEILPSPIDSSLILLKKQKEQDALAIAKQRELALLKRSQDSIKSTLENNIKFNNILFDFNKYDLFPEGKVELDKVIAYLKTQKSAHIEIVGFTDGKGSDVYNLNLSKKRIKSAIDYMIAKGTDIKQIRTKQMGKQNPLEPNENADKNDNPEGRRLNRRIEIKVLKGTQ